MLRIFFLLLTLWVLPAPLFAQNLPSADPVLEARFNACLDLSIDDPASGVSAANAWLIEGGGYFARQCLGFAYSKSGRWDAAADSFAQAARESMRASDRRAANLWTQAGNAALAAGQAQTALSYFDQALAQGTLTGLLQGEVHLDKARALVALEQFVAARIEFGEVHRLVPEDPLGWLLSATLARRMGQLTRARADIGIAQELSPNDADILLETGNIAIVSGDEKAARKAWEEAIRIASAAPAGRIAAEQLARLDESGPVTPPQSDNPSSPGDQTVDQSR